jgi:hypothetical protein
MEAASRLDDKQLAEFLDLAKGADSVELKLTVPEERHRSTIEALDLDPLDAQIRQVFFFDTPELALSEHGIVVRARRVQGKGDDSVVKLRPVVPDDLPAELRAEDDFGVEVDAMPGGFVCSGSMKRAFGGGVREAVAGELPRRKLFSKPQRRLFAERAPEGVALEDLEVLGPVFVLKLKSRPGRIDRKLVTEAWLYPDGAILLELSTKCAPREAIQVAAEARAFLVERGVDVTGDQETKTRKALEFFASQLGG